MSRVHLSGFRPMNREPDRSGEGNRVGSHAADRRLNDPDPIYQPRRSGPPLEVRPIDGLNLPNLIQGEAESIKKVRAVVVRWFDSSTQVRQPPPGPGDVHADRDDRRPEQRRRGFGDSRRAETLRRRVQTRSRGDQEVPRQEVGGRARAKCGVRVGDHRPACIRRVDVLAGLVVDLGDAEGQHQFVGDVVSHNPFELVDRTGRIRRRIDLLKSVSANVSHPQR
jgi:hypothetical protein